MKKQTKGIFFTVLFGGGLLFWATAATLPGIIPEDSESVRTITGTPMDNFPDVQRTQFCGSEDTVQSNHYVKEYKIPTPCTQPLAITSDPNGNLWFTQTNNKGIAKFDPKIEQFTEYENPAWDIIESNAGGPIRSMMWGIDYSPDASIWFTDEATDGIWKFSILDEKYSRYDFPRTADSLPQRLSVEGSQILVNDFTGSKLTFLDIVQSDVGLSHLSIPSPVENSVTAAFALDSKKDIWYTNWVFQGGGVLAKLDQEKMRDIGTNETELFDIVDIHTFPSGMNTPNGIAVDADDNIWIVDTSSNFFFSFEPETESFTKYITSNPQPSSYGNSSGIVKTPVSRPYWAVFDEDGKLVFNEQTANRIGVFDPVKESLVEYTVPSNNPNWADCEGIDNCGLAQIFDFTISGENIWFTEWVENNIGVVDRSLPLYFDIESDKNKLSLKKGEQAQISLSLIPNGVITPDISITSSSTAQFSDLIIKHNAPNTFKLDGDSPKTIDVTISASENAVPDIHKILLSAQTDDLVVSQFVTVIIEQ
jgi:virginiamycin B lyase